MPITLTYPQGGALMAGGTGSIGHGVVEGFCRAGVPVPFTYFGGNRRGSEEKANVLLEKLTASGYAVRARRMDMRDPADIKAALDEVEAWTGRVYTVATTAGAPVPFAKTGDYAPETLEDFFAGDGVAYFKVFRGAIQRMRKSGGGSITCTTTIDVGKLALYNGASGMSKGAVGFKRLLARLKNIKIVEGSDINYQPSLMFNTIGSLQIGFDPASRVVT